MTIQVVYLSRRNLLTLLNKLNRRRNGEDTAATIIKRDTEHPMFPATIDEIAVAAIEDDLYYTDREPGGVLPLDDPDTKKPPSGPKAA